MAKIQYRKVTIKINAIYCPAIGTNPMKLPKGVNGTIIPTSINKIEEKYTILLALLCIKGIFAVLMMCIPTKFETIL